MSFDWIEECEKKNYLDLLLLGDESEVMIDRYLSRGEMYALIENESTLGVCVVTDEGDGVLEIKNIAVSPSAQGRGYGRKIIDSLTQIYREKYRYLQVGTGDSPMTVPFYEKCGFVRSHIIPNFFTDNYDHPIVECGVTLVDMVYFKKKI